jgi:hypothetical protein
MSIKFLNGIDVDNGVLYTDAANDRVGIGTTGPGAKLDVVGTIRTTNASGNQANFTGSSLLFPDASTTTIGANVANFNPGTKNLAIGSSSTKWNAVNVTSNTYRWTSGGFGNGGELNISSSSMDVDVLLKIEDGVNIENLANATSDTDKFLVSDPGQSDRVKYRTGTQVLSDIGAASSSDLSSYLPLAGGTMTGDLLMDGKAGTGNVIGLATGTSSNAMSLKLYTYNNIDPGGGLGTSTGNMIQADLGSNLVLRQTANDGDITFQSDDGLGGIATYLTLDGSSTDAYFSNPGNVGIGATSPNAKLHVSGSGIGAKIHSSQSTGLEVSGGGNTQDIARFQNVAGSTKVTINHAGDVGIGTTSPADKLTVENGNIRLNSTSSYPSQGLLAHWNNSSPGMGGISWRNDPGFIGSEWYHYRQTSPYTQARIRLIGDASSGGMFVNLNGSDVFTIKTSSGNVGIGATSPSYTLDVDGQIRGEQYLRLKDTAGANQFSIRAESTYGTLDNGSKTFNYIASNHLFLVGTSEKMRINSSGNVGINTNGPASKLEVNGEIDANGGDGYRIETKPFATWSSDLLTLGDWDGEGFNTRFMGDTSSEVMRIKGTNVGIGTTAPSGKLEVHGISKFVGSMQFYQGSTSNLYLNIFQSFSSTYINTGTSGETIYFGTPAVNTTNVNVQGTVTATATTDAYKGYIKQNVISYAAEKTESSDYKFTAYNTTATVNSAQAYNRIVAAYSGRVKKVYIRHGGGSTPTATAVNFKKHTNGTTSSTVYAATVANTASANMTAYYEFGNNDFTFNAGDLVGLLYQTTDAFGTASKTMGAVAITITLEYNIT